jgi:hypothetical protein
MSPVRSLIAHDFDIAPRGPYLFDRWIAKEPVENPLGPFDVELRQEPDEVLLRHANELVAFISSEYDVVLNAVYEHYQQTAEQKHWMKSCGVPIGLAEGRVKKYLRSRAIVVRYHRQGLVDAAIYIRPRWDIEHGIHLGLNHGRLFPNPP